MTEIQKEPKNNCLKWQKTEHSHSKKVDPHCCQWNIQCCQMRPNVNVDSISMSLTEDKVHPYEM